MTFGRLAGQVTAVGLDLASLTLSALDSLLVVLDLPFLLFSGCSAKLPTLLFHALTCTLLKQCHAVHVLAFLK